MVSETGPTVEVLTLASANPKAVRSVAGPQHGGLSLLTSQAPEVTHRRSEMVGVSVAPPSKSYTISMSPAVLRTSPLDPAGQPVLPWLNSNPMCAEGEVVFCEMRAHARVRKTSPPTVLL